VEPRWTIDDLVAESRTRLEALPPPKNGQVRAVPDERTIRYYGTIGLLDPPTAFRGRTALYGPRHLAQIVAIKRMQSAGHSLADIQRMWATFDEATLTRVTGVELAVKENARPARRDFWKQEVAAAPAPAAPAAAPMSAPPLAAPPVTASSLAAGGTTSSLAASSTTSSPVELRIELAPGSYIVVAIADGVTISSADVRALREAAAPLVTELARRGLTKEKNP
jgi:DNA-binding transcriptional MerR regulator